MEEGYDRNEEARRGHDVNMAEQNEDNENNPNRDDDGAADDGEGNVHNDNDNDNDDENDNANDENDNANDNDNDNGGVAEVEEAENNNGVIDGGVTVDTADHELSSECPMILYIECEEVLSPSIPAGATISIGLKKTTPLANVFDRFCTFLNSHKVDISLNHEPNDFEFVHCSILNPSDTVETSALMKDDRIKVQRNQEKERKADAEWSSVIRDSDRQYFQQMRTLLPDLSPSPLQSDVIFHCKGKIKDEQGYKQEVLSTFVRGHSALIAKRCTWLAMKIETAKETTDLSHSHPPQHNDDSQDSQEIVPLFRNDNSSSVNNNINDINVNNNNNSSNNNNAVPIPETDDTYPTWQGSRSSGINIAKMENRANAVEDDDDDSNYAYSNNSRNISVDCIAPDNHDSIRSNSPGIGISFFGANIYNTPQVTLSHPPEAVKLLLEYCYTNRVVPLGLKAFKKSYRPINEHTIEKEMREHTGPVNPFSKSAWPNDGMPMISLSVALAGIQLAEEARLPRLSLMCEIAASELVSHVSVLEALALCEEQHRSTGNQLIHLRKAVMLYYILGRGPRGVNDVSSLPSFLRTLKDRSDVVVPSLMMGVMETIRDKQGIDINDNHKDSDKLRAQREDSTLHCYAKLDEDDKIKRDSERMKRRKERWSKRPRKAYNQHNPYGLEKEEHLPCSQVILNDENDFLQEREESMFARRNSGRTSRFGFGDAHRGVLSYRGVHGKNNARATSRSRRRR